MTDSNATELIGCPWCGKKPQLEFSEGRWHVSTYCGHDTDNLTYHNAFVIADTEEQAIAIWNARTPEQAVAATLGCELNPDGLPVGLTISNDENLLNWRGENYVKQAVAATLGESSIEELEADIWRSCEHLTKASNSEILVNVPWEKLRGWLTEAATLGADDGSRWFELFGTPERAAQTLADNCPGGSCGGCPGIKAETCGLGDYDTLLEWLRGKAVKR